MKKNKETVSGIFCAPLFGCFLLFVYAPIETYVHNSIDFTYDIYDLLREMLPVFIGACALAFLVLFLISKISERLFKLASFLAVLIPVAMYIQGTFFSSFLPQLDGEKIDWAAYPKQRVISILLWCSAIILSFFCAKKSTAQKSAAAARKISLAGTFFLLMTVGILVVSGKALEHKKNLVVTEDGMLSLSPDNNVVVLLLDMVGDPEFSDYLERYPEKQQVFDNFTHFNNAVGGYRYSACSIPYIFSGEWFLYQCDFEEYNKRAFEESKVLNTLSAKGYSLGIYDVEAPLTENSAARFINIHEPSSDRFRDPFKFILMQIELSGIRYFPFDLKRFCVLTPQNISDDCAKGMAGEILFEEQSGFLYSQLEEGITASEAMPSFRYIHVQGAHPPYSFDSEFNEVEDASYDEVLGSCVTLVEKLLSEMKKADIYDSSAIVVMADHGGNESRQNPILFVKGMRESHPLQCDASPVIWGDLQEAFLRLADGNNSDCIFDVHENDERERYYYSYGVFGNDPMVEYIQYGKASDQNTLRETGRVYSKNSAS